MSVYYYYLEIPLLCVGITLWIFCCYYVKKRRDDEEESLRFSDSPSVYVIPMYEDEDEDIYEACYGLPYREPRELGLPPPYRCEPPPYGETAPPPYSDLYRNCPGRTAT